MEFFTSVAVGGEAGFRTRGAATFAAVADGGLTVVRVDVVAEKTLPAKSTQTMIEKCIMG